MAKRALITGASSGIGRDIAKELAVIGYDVILVARNEEKLKEIKNEIGQNASIIVMDISNRENCEVLYKQVGFVDILVNNAGFGLFGKFKDTDLNTELQMINTNIIGLHVLTKLFIQDMIKNNTGYILNVSSIAGHLPGPLMDTYYSSKAYVYRLSCSINEELKKDKLNVRVGTLNPGPVTTNFNKVAGVKFNLHSLSSDYVAKYTVNKMLKGKTDITPGFNIKLLRFGAKITPTNILSKIVYRTQKGRDKERK